MIKEKEYVSRRTALGKKLKDNSIGVLFSATMKTRSNDTEYAYRQNSNFYYLSGFKEDNAALVFHKEKGIVKTYMFVQHRDKLLELWTGKRLGEKRAKKHFKVDDVFSIQKLDDMLEEFIKFGQNIYFDFKSDASRIEKIKELSNHYHSHQNIATIIEKSRLIKSDAEIALIKKAISITTDAHHEAMRKSKVFENEYELLAEIEYIFKKNGAYSDAYTSIVASANAANTLHYISNDSKIVDNELILIDAGCEYEYYASDITRTIPANGKFTQAQKELYQMVLDVQEKLINMIKPDVLRTDIQVKSEELLCDGMIKLGILKGDKKVLLKNKAHKKYYPHGVGHWMGIDVHDEAPYRTKKGKEIPLKAGMVMTVEPGIYIDKNDKNIPKKYRGIGIRIEDDILVTKDGYENLSKGIRKSIKEIESIS